jgi:RNA polymerase sigma factor (TIGR02999 family)
MIDPAELTLYLKRWRDGDRAALDELLPRVYDELRRIASAHRRRERDDLTLNTTGIVHEAYLRLAQGTPVDWQDRRHFFSVASTAMRRVLIDHAKERRAKKRGGERVRVEFDVAQLGEAALIEQADPDLVLALDAALARLDAVNARQAKAVELRYFGGLTLEEAADVLGTSAPTVMRDLRFALAWLARELTET